MGKLAPKVPHVVNFKEVTDPPISCDKCVSPGMCCKAFPLNQYFKFGSTPEQVLKFVADQGFPFVPLRRMNMFPMVGQWLEQWQFSCKALAADGRCTIYEKRPKLCSDYQPGTDVMCVHVRGADGKPIVPQKD